MIADAISNIYCIEDDFTCIDAMTRKEIALVMIREIVLMKQIGIAKNSVAPGKNMWKIKNTFSLLRESSGDPHHLLAFCA